MDASGIASAIGIQTKDIRIVLELRKGTGNGLHVLALGT